jgi:hypothetical protein
MYIDVELLPELLSQHVISVVQWLISPSGTDLYSDRRGKRRDK